MESAFCTSGPETIALGQYLLDSALPRGGWTYGAFLDNLHVVPKRTGQGIGRRLLTAVAELLLADGRGGGLYLWVIQQNARARQFYAKAGALEVECTELSMPDGSRLNRDEKGGQTDSIVFRGRYTGIAVEFFRLELV